ncbi:hypothetical protein FOMPIDRAFT_1022586 [Fomitopsis schrenkii]|uniref:DUF7330 domain-containing protein n=1 Tax=Fomitopsis schrenkii TaxID=2126942 RepID=S8FNU3_FOMSC|nr:hypothetical protein FOMPIDRAFT_1022586 [Fomitopsis schrenkii]
MMIINDSVPDKKQHLSSLHAENDDEPPPYDGPSANYSAALTAQAGPVRGSESAAVPNFQPTEQQCVNGVSLFSRHDAICGTYLVDPRIPTTGINSSCRGKFERSVEKAHAKNVRRAFGSVPEDESDASNNADKCRRRSRRPAEVNASFRTRHGPIKVNVGVINSATHAASPSDGRKARGRVMLSSRHGRIGVNMTEIQAGRCADLDVSTRHGNIMVFLPPTFNGSIAVRTRRGPNGVAYMPNFATRARLVRRSDREMLINLSPTPSPADLVKSAQASQKGDDYCVISTRHGKVAIGIYGLDSEADVVQAGGLAAQIEALVENGAKQLETWLTAGAKALENGLQGRRAVVETTLQARLGSLQARSQAAPGLPIAGPSPRV